MRFVTFNPNHLFLQIFPMLVWGSRWSANVRTMGFGEYFTGAQGKTRRPPTGLDIFLDYVMKFVTKISFNIEFSSLFPFPDLDLFCV